MEIKGDKWRASSYLKASQSLSLLGENIRSISERNGLRNIEGVGGSIEAKINEDLATGHIKALDNVMDLLPDDMDTFRENGSLGAHRIAVLHGAGIRSAADLIEAISSDMISCVPELGADVQARLLTEITRIRSEAAEVPSQYALRSASAIIEHIMKGNAADHIEITGNLRRKVRSVSNFTLICSSKDPSQLIGSFGTCPEVVSLDIVESDRAVGRTSSGADCMIKVVEEEDLTLEVFRSTGPEEHVKDVVKMALEHHALLSKKGHVELEDLYDENDIYISAGMIYVPPELRETREPRGTMPLTSKDLTGDLHIRSITADCVMDAKGMAEAAKLFGHSVICFCDRLRDDGPGVEVLDARDAQLEEGMDEWGIEVLKGAEVEISKEGKLMAPSSFLDRMDLVICTVRSGLSMDGPEMTKRVVRAMERSEHGCARTSRGKYHWYQGPLGY